MDLERRLALGVLATHPREAAQVAERLPVEAVAALLAKPDPEVCAGLLSQMTAQAARPILAALAPERASEIVAELSVGVAALILRGLADEVRGPVLAGLPPRRARSLDSLLRFPEGTAGALMDPEVLALPEDMTAAQAVTAVREAARSARYNVYVLDRDERLVGVINQRELLLAPAGALLASFMTRRPHRLPAEADAVAVVTHPAWREVHSLPVVDADGCYLGAMRYRAFRALEEGLRGAREDASVTARALGELFRTGASAVLEMLATPGEGANDGR